MAQRHAAALHAAILADVRRIPSLTELVRSEAQRHRPKLPVPSLHRLPAASVVSTPHSQQKEATCVAVPRSIQ
jgi:hypothetical protein